MSEWPKQWVREGREQGMREGIEQRLAHERALLPDRRPDRGRRRGQRLAHERALLRRMAASRFGADIAERLSEMLASIAEPERLAEVGEWLVRCDTGESFLPVWFRRETRETGATPDGSRRGCSRRVLVCLPSGYSPAIRYDVVTRRDQMRVETEVWWGVASGFASEALWWFRIRESSFMGVGSPSFSPSAPPQVRLSRQAPGHDAPGARR